MFRQVPRRMPFLGAETALGCVSRRQVALPLSLATVAKTGRDFWGERFRAIFSGLPGCRGRLEDPSERKPARRLSDDYGGGSSKCYRKGTRLVQVHPVNGWIWCSWNERRNVSAWTKPPSREQTTFGCRVGTRQPVLPEANRNRRVRDCSAATMRLTISIDRPGRFLWPDKKKHGGAQRSSH
jgi:hypothetical protein